MAVWIGMSNGDFYCDEHVPRGCSCNLHDLDFDGEPNKNTNVIWWSKEDYDKYFQDQSFKELENIATKERRPNSFYYEYVDEKWRREPCCEIEYDKDGFEMEETVYYLNKKDIIEILEMHKLKYSISKSYVTKIKDLLEKTPDRVKYNKFMTELGVFSPQFFKLGYHSPLNIKFYRSIKYKLREKRYKKDKTF